MKHQSSGGETNEIYHTCNKHSPRAGEGERGSGGAPEHSLISFRSHFHEGHAAARAAGACSRVQCVPLKHDLNMPPCWSPLYMFTIESLAGEEYFLINLFERTAL